MPTYAKITASEVYEKVAKHSKWLNGEPFGRQADLRERSLRRMDLRRARLTEADLRHADLRGSDLSKADLRDVTLCHADLEGTNLQGADLRGADLDFACWPLACAGTLTVLDRHLSLQLIYHAFNQAHEDPEIIAALEPLRALAQEFINKHQPTATELRS